ncbi:MAG: muropeptide transporter [Corticimicrobacter sp.]|uniref:muropeptide transporter n=1 Tax=Corticimicrobacter sp. TaxID=2678536 RepID=UPI0032DB4F41
MIYFRRNVWPLLPLGFASGLPLALTGGTLQAWATVENVSLQEIGFLTLIGSAYTLKFLWAPLLDRYRLPWLGRRRGWIFMSQLLLVAGLILMGMLSPASSLWPLALLATVVVFISASQDIAYDAYRVDILKKEERGAGAALSVMGYRLGMLASGGLALVLADRWLGWHNTYFLMGGLMLIGALATLVAPEPERVESAPRTLRAAVIEPFREFFSRREAWALLLLIVLYKLGDAFAGALSTTFLIRGGGYGPAEVGMVNKVLGLAATIVGALAGGALMARLRLYRALMLFGILQALSNLGYWVVAVAPKNIWIMGAAVGFENLCGGLGTAAFVALCLGLCDARFAATQFALLSALSAVGRTYLAGPLTPVLVGWWGWPGFFLATVLISVPGLALLYRRRQDIDRIDQAAVAG